jgi:hypothetical protein
MTLHSQNQNYKLKGKILQNHAENRLSTGLRFTLSTPK